MRKYFFVHLNCLLGRGAVTIGDDDLLLSQIKEDISNLINLLLNCGRENYGGRFLCEVSHFFLKRRARNYGSRKRSARRLNLKCRQPIASAWVTMKETLPFPLATQIHANRQSQTMSDDTCNTSHSY